MFCLDQNFLDQGLAALVHDFTTEDTILWEILAASPATLVIT